MICCIQLLVFAKDDHFDLFEEEFLYCSSFATATNTTDFLKMIVLFLETKKFVVE